MAKKYIWLKLQHDFFNNKEIKKLRKIAGGDTYVIIYLKLQLLSLKNEGKLFFEGFEDDIASELALDIDEEDENVKITFMFLKKYNLIEEINENEFILPKTVNSIGAESDSAERVRKYRERKALQCNGKVTPVTFQVTSSNTEREKEIYKEEEYKEEKERERETDKCPIDYNLIKDSFNKTCTTLPQVKTLTTARKKTINTIIKNEKEFNFDSFFKIVNESDFLSGKSGKWNGCSFDWILKPSNRIKILEGNYNNKTNNNITNNQESDIDQLKRLRDQAIKREQERGII